MFKAVSIASDRTQGKVRGRMAVKTRPHPNQPTATR